MNSTEKRKKNTGAILPWRKGFIQAAIRYVKGAVKELAPSESTTRRAALASSCGTGQCSHVCARCAIYRGATPARPKRDPRDTL
jgi:hypothetical protein